MTASKGGKKDVAARPDTRERILVSTLSLFNQKGPEAVTTAEIAKAVHINQGNLYYHFRTKESLVLALFSRFEADALALVRQADSVEGADSKAYAGFLRKWFSLVWTHRFLFRDIPGLLAIAPGLRGPILMVSAGMRVSVDAIFQRMEEAGLISTAAEERNALMTNMRIVATYWAVYLGLQEGVGELTPQHVHWGLGQVASLLRPYLSPQARADLEEMLAEPFA
ncbi:MULTISPECIES: TetR/AcrR family transcriptional regulator [Rhizobium]|uniref:TetR family transcriptional regulator n=1 Tax=Rhizobium dioscoreae TaxID=2653122 RepID=A0ABQ0Z042_9HYPH|nr:MULTISPECIES: TetR/AcrR family transcriptional regulator [Rhizobium]MCZ3376801.1 TetR/AcrR family transcriptional regulator [Rhizobium sp. AG207R]TWB11383.1 TetR family transcriptional regulator [Rhizobium sp. ERR1071]GES48854.1 TetR family transcriptional regulator [Rhizobium dioscoreae]GLU80297.1 TetR family transcriptional regulator [Rhizobium sp. NBRC 114257]